MEVVEACNCLRLTKGCRFLSRTMAESNLSRMFIGLTNGEMGADDLFGTWIIDRVGRKQPDAPDRGNGIGVAPIPKTSALLPTPVCWCELRGRSSLRVAWSSQAEAR